MDKTAAKAISTFDDLPDSFFVNKKVVEVLFCISEPTLWRMVKDKRLPAPIRLSPTTSRWQVGDLRAALASFQVAGGA